MVLAAGLSRRTGAVDKLTARVDGQPMLWHPIRAALEAGLDPVVVVTGEAGSGAHAAVEEFAGRRAEPDAATLRHVVNPTRDRGLASSLRLGLFNLGAEPAAAVILLGDMPWVRPETIRALVQAFHGGGPAPCVPVRGGRRGNPVLWPAGWFPALADLEGDEGARRILRDPGTPIRQVPVEDPGIHRDVDTPGDIAALDG